MAPWIFCLIILMSNRFKRERKLEKRYEMQDFVLNLWLD